MVETILYQEWKKLSMTGFWNFLSMYFRRDFDTLSAHALYLENYDSYDIGVFVDRLISTNLPGVGVIRFTL